MKKELEENVDFVYKHKMPADMLEQYEVWLKKNKDKYDSLDIELEIQKVYRGLSGDEEILKVEAVIMWVFIEFKKWYMPRQIVAKIRAIAPDLLQLNMLLNDYEKIVNDNP